MDVWLSAFLIVLCVFCIVMAVRSWRADRREDSGEDGPNR